MHVGSNQILFRYNMVSPNDWRRIDTDVYDRETHMSAAELIPNLPATLRDEVTQVSREARLALSSGQFQLALTLVLDMRPYVADVSIKLMHAETVFEVLCSIKNNHLGNDFSSFIKALTLDQQDILIKYLYKIMATLYGAKQGGLLLSWFEKTTEVAGLGCIVRYMSDRRVL